MVSNTKPSHSTYRPVKSDIRRTVVKDSGETSDHGTETEDLPPIEKPKTDSRFPYDFDDWSGAF